MAVSAYVLINTSHLDVKNALTQLRGIPAVKSAMAVTGPYDVVAVVEAEDMDKLGKLIVQELQPISGIERSLTCIIFEP